MSPAAELFIARVRVEEGSRHMPYDDATGLTVRAPKGFISWGWGFNLQQCGSEGLFEVMVRYLVAQVETVLLGKEFYAKADPVRQSVFLDIAYNGGVNGLLRGYPKMIAHANAGDWTDAAAECNVADLKLDASRYAPLRALLLSGASPA